MSFLNQLKSIFDIILEGKQPPQQTTDDAMPKSAEEYHSQGIKRTSSGDLESIADFDRAIQLNHNLANAYLNRGNVRSVLGNIKGANLDYQIAAELFQTRGDLALSRIVNDLLS